MKCKTFCLVQSFMTQNRWVCLSDLSIIPKAHITELILPIIEDSSISKLGCPFSVGSNAKGLWLQKQWKNFLILAVNNLNNFIITLFYAFGICKALQNSLTRLYDLLMLVFLIKQLNVK